MSNQKDVEMFGENSIFVKQNKALDLIKQDNEQTVERIKSHIPQKSEQVLECENPLYNFFRSLDEKIDCSQTINAFNREVNVHNRNIRSLEAENKNIDRLKTSGTIEEKDFIIADQNLKGIIDKHPRGYDAGFGPVIAATAMENLIHKLNDAEKEMVEAAHNNAEVVIKHLSK